MTITKAITISCPYTEGGVLAAGNGIVVNAGANDVVVLRGLDIYGVNPPTNGVRFIAGRALHIENSIIRRFNSTNSAGVSFAPSGTSRLYVTDTTITDNGNGTTGGGIIVQPTSNGTATVALLRVSLNNNANNGLRIDSSTAGVAGVFASVEDSQFAGNTNGVSVQSAINVATVVINDSTIVNNTGTGIISAGNGSSVAVGDSTISGNADGLLLSGGAVIKTFGNNRLGPNPNFDAPVIDNFTQPPLPPS
ncbi:MAG: hypothetical protein ACXWUN_04915 [Allosphingosinicella sp.]